MTTLASASLSRHSRADIVGSCTHRLSWFVSGCHMHIICDSDARRSLEPKIRLSHRRDIVTESLHHAKASSVAIRVVGTNWGRARGRARGRLLGGCISAIKRLIGTKPAATQRPYGLLNTRTSL